MKRLSRAEPSAAEVARLGEDLRDTRERLGLSIEDLAASLRIRRVYLAALEEGRVRDLPAPAYAVGFVRSYARALGLDDDAVVRRFREGTPTVVQRRTDLVFPEPVPERGVPAGALVLAGAVLVIGAYVGWWHWSGGGTRTVDAVPPPPPRLEDLAAARDAAIPAAPPRTEGVTAAAPPATQPPVTPIQTPPTSAAAATAPAPPRVPVAGPGTAPAAALPPPTPVTPAAPHAVVAPPPAPAPGGASPTPRSGEDGRILLRARAVEVWIQVRASPNGPIVVDRTLRAGETWAVPAREGLVLTTGNAPGLEVMVDGQPATGALGAGPSTVRRGVALDPERLKAGTAVATAPAAAVGQGAGAAPRAAASPASRPGPAPQ